MHYVVLMKLQFRKTIF